MVPEYCSNLVNIWARKIFLFFKQVRISTDIDWFHYETVNAAPTSTLRRWIKTYQFWWCVISDPDIGGWVGLFAKSFFFVKPKLWNVSLRLSRVGVVTLFVATNIIDSQSLMPMSLPRYLCCIIFHLKLRIFVCLCILCNKWGWYWYHLYNQFSFWFCNGII